MKTQTLKKEPTSIPEFVDPFPGLRPFGIEESHLFFGREGQSDEILTKLSHNNFVAILGASGSGKSSLMYCGLIPTLYGGFMTKAGSNWKVIITRPGGGPIDNLAEALLKAEEAYHDLEEEGQLIRRTIASTVLRSSSLGLIEVVKQLKYSENHNVLVLVDQFEELFRYKKLEKPATGWNESSVFVNLLMQAVHQHNSSIYVAFTMRSDFIGDCAAYPDLTQMINDSHYLIPQMTREQKRLAIEGPVAVGGGKIAPRLTQQLLNDVGDNPDQLPILQHALMRTWQFWKESGVDGEPMSLKHYNAIGTLSDALSMHANEAFDSLNNREQQICESMFKALTERGTEMSGIRRPTQLGTIAAIAGVNNQEVIHVVDKFREPGRTLLMPPYGVKIKSDTVIDISHESLMRIWSRMKAWLEEEARSAEMYLKLSESAERFQQGKAGLWKMPDLQLALNWKEENHPTLVWGQRYNLAFERTMVFLETSQKAHENEQRNKELLQKRALKRSRTTALILGFAMMVCIFLVVFANIQANEAKKQEASAQVNLTLAEEQTKKATEQEKIAAAEAAKAKISARKAKEQAEIAQKAQQQANIEKQSAERNAIAAQVAQAEAEKERVIAQEAQKKADRNATSAAESAKRAEKERAVAEALRYQAIANSMAVKSKNIEEDPEQKALIARQAWLFDSEYGVKKYNADVYSGVYYAYKALMDIDSATQNFNHYTGHSPGEAVRSVAYSKDGKKAYSAGSDGKVIVWDMTGKKRTPEKVLYQNVHINRVIDISPNEKWLAVGTDENHIVLYNLKDSSQPPKEVTVNQGVVFDLVFLQDNSGFFFVSDDSVMRRSDFKTTTEVAKINTRVKALALSPNDKFLAGGSEAGLIYLWDVKQGNHEKIISPEDDTPIHAVAFSADGKILAIGNDKGDIILWDIEENRPTRRLTGHKSQITDMEFRQDNTLLASSSLDGTTRIWVMKHLNDLPIVLDDHGKGSEQNRWVWSVAFSPDSPALITGAGDGIIRYWSLDPAEMANSVCQNKHIIRNLSDTEWNIYVGEDISFRETCKGKPQRVETQ